VRVLIKSSLTHALVHFSDYYEGEVGELFKRACAMGLEDIASKRVLSPYEMKPELMMKVRHLAGGDTLRHASVQGSALRPVT
jgi:hypothetical protein